MRRREVWAGVAGLTTAVVINFRGAVGHAIGWAWTEGVEWLYWPEAGKGYAAASSIGGDTAIVGSVIATALLSWRAYKQRTECHEDDCHEHGKYVIEGGVRCCDTHHPALDERPVEERGHVHTLHMAHIRHVEMHRRITG